MKKIFCLTFALIAALQLCAQPIIHSHNDYRQKLPFWEAYNHSMQSIEVDLYLRGDEIVVCHDVNEVASAPTFEQLYIAPMLSIGEKAKDFNLLIDFKSPASQLMKPFMELVSCYPQIFAKDKIKLVISGSRPAKNVWANYPAYVLFDGRFSESYTKSELEKVGMISDDLKNYTDWNGKGSIPPSEVIKLELTISEAHAKGKPVRFWGAADNPNTWITFHKMGIDIINTDKIAKCADFFASYNKSEYTFNGKCETYTPTYETDGKAGKPKNVILIIGDGMSITQITAAETANHGELSLLNMKNIGFITTESTNDYNPDSAGAGSALATGQKTNNRYISTSPQGEVVENSAEAFSSLGKKIGIITSGDVTDATPATQYAHNVERNNAEEIALWLKNGKVDMLVGSNSQPFIKRKDARNLFNELRTDGYSILQNSDSISKINNDNKIVCIDKRFGDHCNESTIDYLSTTTADVIKKLQNPKGFYMMVEASKIDHGGHANNMKTIVIETLSLDAVVREALEFADKDKNTLVIVTADHETGALVILDGDREKGQVNGYFASDDHTGVLIPIFAYGVGAQEFRGVYKNTEVFNKIKGLIK
jgi:alkaline phosphatase